MNASVSLLLILGVIAIIVALVLFGGISFLTTKKLIRDNTDLVDFIMKRASEKESEMPSPTDRLNEIKDRKKSFADMTDDQVMAYIDAEMDQKQHFRKQDLGLKDLSIELGLPQSRIVKILHDREYGTLKEYLTTRRLLYACELLQTKPYYTIDSISSDAGFKARKTFQTLFKARIGVTPSQYRDNFKIQQNLEASTE